MPEVRLTPLTADDGLTLAVYDWEQDSGREVRGVVLIVHGLGEHALRYQHLAERLNAWGFHVRAYDQFGHGESAGERGAMPHASKLVDDLNEVLDDTTRRWPGKPRFVLGHSMGGLVAAHYVQQHPAALLTGLVLSSPALNPGLNPLQKLLLAVLPKIAPNLRVNNGLKAHHLSHDPDVVEAYVNDPSVHKKISARLALYIAQTGRQMIAAAPQWRLPTLLMYAGADRLVSPKGSQAFAARASNVVSVQRFKDMYHEIFNEPDNEEALEQLEGWLDERISGLGPAQFSPSHKPQPR
jgi:alpha-beta hydrolase superfamily lysophospholipase